MPPMPMRTELDPDELVALNRLALVARVLAGTAHDVNNALQIISGSAELLGGQDELSERARRAVQRIQAQATRAASVVDDVMRFARDRGEATGRVALRDAISRAVSMRAFQIRRAGLVLQFDATAAPPAYVTGRAAQLQQAALNLIMNAEQAVQGVTGGVIMLDVSASEGEVVLRVVDNGRGIPPELGEAVFEPFATTRPVPDASGLGLTVARLIARAHGGELTLEPRHPGSCAVLRLPAAGDASAD